MAEKLNVELREDFGKGASRRLRAESRVPAVLYGHGQDPVHLSLPGHDTALAARNPNALLELVLPDGETHLALIKEIQRHPLKRSLNHLDLIVVRKGEKVEVDVTVQVEGEAAPDTVVTTDYVELTVLAEATNIPEGFTVSVEGLEAGSQILAGQVDLPDGVTLVTDPEALVVNVTQAISQEALDAELAEAEADAGIEQDEPEAVEDAPTEDEPTPDE